ncbi:HD domain-containing protein [Deinococcus altitudinis]|uniref:HD domain-containing protein n=1 Tax=Deinococcus altitudinis TaxID=468914 RepID=UPI003891948B
MFRRALPPAPLRSIWPQGAVLVGGAARDLLRGSVPNDWDWAAPDPQAAAEILATMLGGAVFALDQERGYYRVTVPADGDDEARQHDLVPLPTRLEDDLLRRDFTVNALALHLNGTVTDPTGGQKDLKARRLKMVDEANLRADPLRLLRAARLSVTLGFALEPRTREAVTRLARDRSLPSPAPERVREELHSLLLHPQAASGVLLLEDLGLLEQYLPELAQGRGVTQGGFHHLDVFGHSGEALHQLVLRFPDAPLALRWATLLHDIGKPPTREEANGQTRYHGHERVGAELARQRLEQLREPHAVVGEVSALIAAHMLPLPGNEREARRFVHRRRALLPGLLALMLADREAARGPSSNAASRLAYQQGFDRLLAALENQPAPEAPLLSGQELMALLNLSPGPRVGQAVRALAEARALGDVRSAEEARTWLLGGGWPSGAEPG